MTEEKYENGDITWINYLGVFKAFDKDGNEIKFPTDNTGYQVKLDVQGILNLYEENKRLKRIEELRIAQIENLKQENENAKTTVEECHKYMAKLEDENEELKELNKKICEDWEKEIKVYWNALEEIREIAKGLKQTKIPFCEIEEKIQNKINEVLSE